MIDFGFYNMDCMEGMRQFPDKYFDLAIVDPPYGGNDAIGIKNCNNHKAIRKEYILFENTAPSQDYFDELKRVSKNQIIWGVIFIRLKDWRVGGLYGTNMVRLLDVRNWHI